MKEIKRQKRVNKEESHVKKFERIKKEVKRGLYTVKSREIADKMVQKLKEKTIFTLNS